MEFLLLEYIVKEFPLSFSSKCLVHKVKALLKQKFYSQAQGSALGSRSSLGQVQGWVMFRSRSELQVQNLQGDVQCIKERAKQISWLLSKAIKRPLKRALNITAERKDLNKKQFGLAIICFALFFLNLLENLELSYIN